jgi:hypothetical protein
MKILKTCKQCNITFEADSREINRGNAKYCSLSCAAKNQRKNAKLYEKTCLGCNNIFKAKYSEAKYCSQSCKLKVYRRLQKSKEASIATFYRILTDTPCEICGWNETNRDLHHIIPVSQGGKTTLDNIVSLCPNHHRMAHKDMLSREELLTAIKPRVQKI